MQADGLEVEHEQLSNMLYEMSISDEESWKQVVEFYSFEESMEWEVLPSDEAKMTIEEEQECVASKDENYVVVHHFEAPASSCKQIQVTSLETAGLRFPLKYRALDTHGLILSTVFNRNFMYQAPSLLKILFVVRRCKFQKALQIKLYPELLYNNMSFIYMELILMLPSILIVSPLMYSF